MHFMQRFRTYVIKERSKIFWKNIVICTIALLIAVLVKKVICIDIRPGVRKYCREQEILNSSDEVDEYLVVDAEINSTIILECSFCGNASENQQPKHWRRQDLDQATELREVELGMDNDVSLIRVHMTAELKLIIRLFREEDAGIYRCYGERDQEMENMFNYRLEPVFEDESTNSTERGDLTNWEKYREVNLDPVTLQFAVSDVHEFEIIREEGIILELVSEWGPWSPCEDCVSRRGIKTSRACCRIKRTFNETILDADSEIVQFFLKAPLLPCRSRILHERFPDVGNATRYLPEFLLTEKCKGCKKKKRKHKFKYRKRYVLDDGANLAISCPESTVESDVIWRKDSLVLKKGEGRSFRKSDPKPRVFLDNFYTLYLKDVSKHEKGNYTCSSDNTRMLQAKVIVLPKRGLLTQGFVRHLGYLSIIFLFTSACYCAGVVRAYRRRGDFKIQTYEEIEEGEKLLEDSN